MSIAPPLYDPRFFLVFSCLKSLPLTCTLLHELLDSSCSHALHWKTYQLQVNSCKDGNDFRSRTFVCPSCSAWAAVTCRSCAVLKVSCAACNKCAPWQSTIILMQTFAIHTNATMRHDARWLAELTRFRLFTCSSVSEALAPQPEEPNLAAYELSHAPFLSSHSSSFTRLKALAPVGPFATILPAAGTIQVDVPSCSVTGRSHAQCHRVIPCSSCLE